MKHKEIIYILISSAILTVIWISFSLFHAWRTSTISQDLQEAITPIDGSFDTQTITSLKTRIIVTPQDNAPQSAPSSSPELSPAQPTTTPSISVSPTPAASPLTTQISPPVPPGNSPNTNSVSTFTPTPTPSSSTVPLQLEGTGL